MLGLPTKPSKALMVWSFKGKPNLTPGIALSLVNSASVIETFWVFNNLFNTSAVISLKSLKVVLFGVVL